MRYHHGCRNGAGSLRSRLRPTNGSGTVPSAISAARTVDGTDVGCHPAVSNPTAEIAAGEAVQRSAA